MLFFFFFFWPRGGKYLLSFLLWFSLVNKLTSSSLFFISFHIATCFLLLLTSKNNNNNTKPLLVLRTSLVANSPILFPTIASWENYWASCFYCLLPPCTKSLRHCSGALGRDSGGFSQSVDPALWAGKWVKVVTSGIFVLSFPVWNLCTVS